MISAFRAVFGSLFHAARHSELNEESFNEILRLKPQGATHVGTFDNNRRAAFTLAEGATHVNMSNNNRRAAFTLAEVLITLGIIGIVAALTIPTLVKNFQDNVLKNQYKKMYSVLNQAILNTQTLNGSPIKCFYWDTGRKCKEKCLLKNEFGSCIGGYVCEDTGKPIPADQNGLINECKIFRQKLFTEVLKLSKMCIDNAYEQGCLPADIRGIDKVKEENDPNVQIDPGTLFSDSRIKNSTSVYVLADGTYLIDVVKYTNDDYAYPVFTFDINGHKGPNKWGYDIFSFQIIGNSNVGIKGMAPLTYATEKGGVSSDVMYNKVFK